MEHGAFNGDVENFSEAWGSTVNTKCALPSKWRQRAVHPDSRTNGPDSIEKKGSAVILSGYNSCGRPPSPLWQTEAPEAVERWC